MKYVAFAGVYVFVGQRCRETRIRFDSTGQRQRATAGAPPYSTFLCVANRDENPIFGGPLVLLLASPFMGFFLGFLGDVVACPWLVFVGASTTTSPADPDDRLLEPFNTSWRLAWKLSSFRQWNVSENYLIRRPDLWNTTKT